MNTPDLIGLLILVIYIGAIGIGIFGLLERKIQANPEAEEHKLD
jgi:hypothetical protein